MLHSAQIPPKAAGFSLLELTVAVAVVAILSALLFPTLSSTVRKAQSAKCLGNLRKLAELYMVYSAENGGRLLAALDASESPPRHDTPQSGNWQINLQPLLRPLRAGEVRRLPELSCPGLPKFYRSNVNTSYAMNFHICEIHLTLPGPTRVGQVTHPAQLALFADSRGISEGRTQGTFSFSMLPVDWHSPASTPQDKLMSNIAFFDGHVARMPIADIPAINPRTGGGNSPASRFWLGY